MSMPQVHIVAYCTDLGFGAARGAEMLSLMLACGIVSRLVFGVISDRMGGVRLGLRAEIVSDTYPDRVYEGEVVFVGNEAEFTPRNVQTAAERTKLVYPVKVRVLGDTDFVLKPGIPVDVTLLEPEA